MKDYLSRLIGLPGLAEVVGLSFAIRLAISVDPAASLAPVATPWPPRSPDLTSCDNALWGIVKNLVKGERPTTLPQLKDSITQAFMHIGAEMLGKIHERTWRRIALCVALQGKQVDPYDKK